MNNKKKRNSILVQGSILALASIISRIIGLIYRGPLTAIIGKTGNDYYGTAYSIYNIVLIFSSYSIPLAVSKIISGKIAVKEYENAKRAFLGSFVFSIISGFLGMSVLFFGADMFSASLRTPLASYAVKILAPVILIVALSGALRGFFQGMNTMVPSALSQIIEQIINAIVSVVAAYFLFSYGLKLGKANNIKHLKEAYGAAGGTLGTAIGALFSLIFLLFIYFIFITHFNKRIIKEKNHSKKESYIKIFKVLILTIIPVLLSTAIYNGFDIVEAFIFKNMAFLKGYNRDKVSIWWGVYTGEVNVLRNIPTSIASALAASSVPAIAASFKKRDYKEVDRQILSVTRFVSIISFPCTIGLIVLAGPILRILFGDTDVESIRMLIVGIISIPFFCISTLSNGLLQGIDKMIEPIKNAIIAIIGHAIFLVVVMQFTNLHIYTVLISLLFYGLLISLLNRLSLKKYRNISFDLIKTYIMPLIASLIMGVFVYFTYKGIYMIIHSSLIAMTISIFVGMFVYFVTIIKIHVVDEEELRGFPKGHKLIGLARKLHLLK